MSASPVMPVGGVIDSAAYARGLRVATLPIFQLAEAASHPDWFVWVGLYEPEEDLLREVQQAFELHDLAIEDAHSAHQRPKLEVYGDSLFVVLRTVRRAEGAQGLEFGETHVFVGKPYVVTVRHGSLKSHVGLRARCEAAPQLLSQGSAYVLHALMDFIVDQYFPIVASLETELDELEREIFSGECRRSVTGRMYHLRRDLIALKQAVTPLIDISSQLMRFPSDLIPRETRPYFQNVNDHVLRIVEIIDNLQELSHSALEANLSLISLSQNDDTKRLAAWAAILAVPTMIAGLYGMNFSHMPELQWQYGYPSALVLMGATCFLIHRAFRRAGWLTGLTL